MVFPVDVWMWKLDYKESWVLKNWCFWTVVLEKTLESPLDCKEIQPVHSKGDQPWDFFGRTDAKVETPVLWPPHAKSWLIGKDSDGHEFGWTPGVGDGQGGLCAAIHGVAKSWTRLSDWTELKISFCICHSLSEFGKPKVVKFHFSTFLSEAIDCKASASQSKMEHGFNSFKAS